MKRAIALFFFFFFFLMVKPPNDQTKMATFLLNFSKGTKGLLCASCSDISPQIWCRSVKLVSGDNPCID